MINYAHRGASEFYPENTLYAFYMGLEMKANGIETDIQRTKDGVLVLFHDNDLKRILGIEKSIKDYTYDELLKLDFGIFKGPQFANEKIVTLKEFLTHFGSKNLQLALEIKQPGIEVDLLNMIHQCCVKENVIITSFHWDSIVKARSLDSDITLGYLTSFVDNDLLDKLVQSGIQQICPQASHFTEELNQAARSRKLSVRFWGVTNDALMRKAIDMGVDGMTINNPQALADELGW